jgi:hypothetical protein
MYQLKDDAKGPMSLFGQLSNFANQYGGLTEQEQNYLNSYQQNIDTNRSNLMDFAFNQAAGLQGKLNNGTYDPRYQTQAYTAGANTADANTADANTAVAALANAYTGNMINGRAAQGVLDPTNSMLSLLSGQPDNPYLSAMNQGNINQALRGYDDALSNFTQQVIPSINNDAFAAGQYGSSRQGVAEGLAGQQMLRNARDLGIAAMDSGNRLFGGAYENAQGRKASTAQSLNDQAYGMEQFNAGQFQDISKFNANQLQDISKFNATNLNNMNQFNAGQLQQNNQFNATNLNNMNQFNAGQLQNNDQFAANLDMQQKEMAKQNALQGLQTLNDANSNLWSAQDQLFATQMNNAAMPMNRQMDMLNAQAGVFLPGASLGGATTQRTPIYSNNAGNILGGLGSAAGLLSMIK